MDAQQTSKKPALLNEGKTNENSSGANTEVGLRNGDDPSRMGARLEGIQTLLSHLHGEITALEESYHRVLGLLRQFEGACETDDMTGLLRKRPFSERFQSLLDECQHARTDCAVIMVDIDHFKKVNDTFGHLTGDEVIKRIAGLLQELQAPDCLVCRYGGEEFVIAIQGTESRVQGLAERIRRDFERIRIRALGEDGKPSEKVLLRCTASLGVASASIVGFDATRLLHAADQALYASKRGGRNQVRVCKSRKH